MTCLGQCVQGATNERNAKKLELEEKETLQDGKIEGKRGREGEEEEKEREKIVLG